MRLRVMVEVLSNWREYVTDEAHLARRGATSFSMTMAACSTSTGTRVYSPILKRWRAPFILEPYIGAKALDVRT